MFNLVEDADINTTKQRSFFTTLLPLFVVAHFAHHLLTALPTPLLPFIRSDFRLNYTQSALVTMAFSLSYGIGQLPAGWLADRIGPRLLITIGILGVAVAGVLVGISHTFIMMIVFLVLMGLLGGGYHPSSAPLISASVEPKQRGRALGIHLIGGSGSFFLAPIIAAAIASAWGWRGSFLWLAVPTAAFGVIFYLLLGHGRGTSHVARMAAKYPAGEEAAPGNMRRLVALLVLIVVGSGASMSITVFIPLYVEAYFGVSKQVAASLLAINFSAGLWASPLGGYFSDRVGRVPIILASGIIGGVLIYLLRVVPYGYTIGSVGLGIGAVLFFMGINSYVRMPVSEAYIMGLTPVRHRSTFYGIYYFAMQEAGAVFAPLMGYITDKYDFHTTFTIAGIVMVVTTLVCAPFLWGSRD